MNIDVSGKADVAPGLAVVLTEIAAERERHVREGYGPLHDDTLTAGELIDEAFLHIGSAGEDPSDADMRPVLLTAAALLIAEIQRLDRKPAAHQGPVARQPSTAPRKEAPRPSHHV